MNNKNKSKKNNQKNPWTPEDEGDHYPSMKEWWCIQTFLKTLDDDRKWNLKSSFAYELERPSCFFLCHLFDITSKKLVVRKSINDRLDKLSIKKNKVDLKYEKNFLNGLYPNYNLQINDAEKEIFADIKFKAKILPHWSAQDISNGYLPFGLDYFRYGWLLNCDLSGSLTVKGESHKIKGKGYLEKAWGNWSYTNPFQKLSGFRKAFSTYGNLFYWWFLHRKPKVIDSISFTTENNPFGYDWFWGIFDNDWSIFYGNALFWVSKGPAFGVLTLFKEGNNYIDFSNVNFHYNKTNYIKKYDMYYPIDLSITAKQDDKKIKLRAYPTFNIYEYVEKFEGDGFYRAFALPEIPGRIDGVYSDNENHIKLKGDCKIEPQRQPSKLGHNLIKIDILKPPKGVGLKLDFESHYLEKKGSALFRLAPHPRFFLNFKKIYSYETVNKKK
jgi:hypothetical protein